MTDADKIARLSAMTEEADPAVLSTYLDLAKDAILGYAYPYTDPPADLPARYDSLQVEIAAYKLNKRGAEGETAHSENGVSRSYESGDIPRGLLRRITPHAKVVIHETT